MKRRLKRYSLVMIFVMVLSIFGPNWLGIYSVRGENVSTEDEVPAETTTISAQSTDETTKNTEDPPPEVTEEAPVIFEVEEEPLSEEPPLETSSDIPEESPPIVEPVEAPPQDVEEPIPEGTDEPEPVPEEPTVEVPKESTEEIPPTEEVTEESETEENPTGEPIEEETDPVEDPEETKEETEQETEESSEEIEEKEMVTLTFDTLGGPILEEVKVEKGSILSELPKLEWNGFEFLGWAVSKDSESLLELPFTVESDLTLYAAWIDHFEPSYPDGHFGPEPGENTYFDYGIFPATPLGGFNTQRNITLASDLVPGEVRLSKTATPVEGKVNVWEVELKIEGRNSEETSDIVLVIDRSGSMNYYGRMASAKKAATDFVDELLRGNGARLNRIGIVSFAGDVVTNQALTANQTSLKNAINGLEAYGGTYTQAALRQAELILANSDATHKNIVLLSDGVPTYSVRLSDPDAYLIAYGYNLQTGSHAPQTAYAYTGSPSRVGDGSGMYFRYQENWFSSDKYYNHGNSLIAQGRFAKNAGYTVYTVALDAGTVGNSVLNHTASPGKAFTASPSDLGSIFDTIAGDIGSAVKNANINDPMGLGFQVIGTVSDLAVSQGTATLESVNGRDVINWNAGTLTTPNNSDVKYATLKYQIEINDDILDVDPTPEDGLYLTNDGATVNYTNVNSVNVTEEFPQPKVDPVLLIVEKVLLNDAGELITEDERIFNINITNQSGDYNEDYPLKAGQRRVMTNLRLEDSYVVTETTVDGIAEAVHDYTASVNVYGEDNSEFTIRQGDPDSPVIVTNQEKSLGKITVKKIFTNTKDDQPMGLMSDQPLEFSFVLHKADGTTQDFTLKAGEEKVFENLPYGTYKVVEEEDSEYAPTYDPENGEVTISFSDREKTVTVTNQVTELIDIEAIKVWAGPEQPVRPDIWFKLYRASTGEPEKVHVPDTEIIQVPESLSVTWTNLPKYDGQGYLYEYSVQEVYSDGSNMIPAGYTKKEDGLEVTNTFTPINPSNITSLCFDKIWSPADLGEYPPITVEVMNGETVVATAQLEYPQTYVEWKNLPYADENGIPIDYTIREIEIEGYEVEKTGETESYIEEITSVPSNNATGWDVKKPSFIVTRTTRQGGAFVIWTLNHLPVEKRGEFLGALFDTDATNDQPIRDLQQHYGPGATPSIPIVWLEGSSISTDIYPDEDGVGKIEIEITFNDDGTIATAYIYFEKQNTWTHFAYGHYSSKSIEFTNTYNATGSWIPEVTKVLAGRTLKEGDFTFELKQGDEVLQTKTNAADGKVVFDAIQYTPTDIGKTYTYTIVEVKGSEEGMTYDSMVVTITVTVEFGVNNLIVTPEYPEDTEFNNSYEASGSWTPKVTKALAGRALKEGDFTFELKQGDEVLQTKTNAADGSVTFDAMEYTQDDIDKTFTYTIVEVVPDPAEGGMTYDEMVVTITVTVVDAGGGTLTVTPTYPDDTTFNNVYKASGSWTPKVTKALAGRALKEGDFTFELKQGDEVLQTKTNATDGSVTFDAIEYTQEDIGKTYTYTIVEVAGAEGGMTYDPMVVTITVTVVDAGEGKLTVTPEYPKDIEFNNSYEASGSWTPEVTKELTGRALKEGEFTFELKQGDEVLQTKTNAADGSVTFDAIEYTQEDIGETYTYTIVEVAGSEEGMTYDPMTVTITVTVIDAGGGVLTVTPAYPEDIEFNNSYEASGSWKPQVTKALEGRALEEGEFTFNLLDKDENIIGTASNNILGKIVFDSIDYTQADIGKTYTYTIVEVAGAEGGMTYDTMVVTITVTVVDAGGGTLTVIPEYPKDTEFNNSYTASGSWKPEVAKALAGRALKDGEFTFELRQGETVLQTKTNAADGKVVFDSIDYTQADIGKTYTYTIVEVAGTEGGMTYDPMVVTVTAVVTDAGGGTLTITPTYPEDTKFNNTYAAGGNFTPSVSKILNGREIEENEFTFELRQDETVLQTKTNAADGSVSFDAIDYTQEDIGKTYVYQVVELKGSEGGMTYDEQTVTITVTVEDLGGGELLVTAVYSPEGRLFTNTYAASGNWTPEVTKVLEGRDLKKDEFTFELRQGDTVLQTKTNAVDGNVVFDPIEYSQVDIGKTYTYTIVEVAGTEGGMTYDPMVVTITVTVADAGNGNLTITPTYSENTKFENTYEATGSWKPIVTKLLDAGGRELQEGEFTFELWLDGVKLQDGYNLADGTIEFERVPYTQADIGKTYTYTIVEVKPDPAEGGMTYDPMVVTITVTVADAGEGKLTVTATYPDSRTFTNSYEASGEWLPEVTKSLDGGGRKLEEGEFTFRLWLDDEMLQEVSNLEDGSIVFMPVEYSQDDIGKSYTYTIVEVAGTEDGMTYSEESIEVTVTIEDAGNGELEVIVIYPNITEFENSYVAFGYYTPVLEKVLQGRDLQDQEFEFELYMGDDLLETAKNDEHGNVTFSMIAYDQGAIGETYELTVVEVPGSEAGMTYSKHIATITIVITDAGNRELDIKATIDDPTFVNIYEASGSYTPTVEKFLNGKNLEADAFEFELLDAEVKVLQTKTNAADGTVTFDALTFSQDDIGKTFEFSVREVTGAHGNIEYDELAHIFQLKVEDAGDGKLTVTRVDVDTDTPFVFTNTWQTKAVTATKTWVGAPDDKPTVWFKLQRAVGTGPAADVPGAPIMELDGETEVTWLNLDVKDEDGAEYIYRVVEVDKDGKDFVPEGYKKVEEGLKITNTFIPKPVDPPAPTTKVPDPIVKTGGSDPYSALGMLLLLGGAGMFLLRRRKEDVND